MIPEGGSLGLLRAGVLPEWARPERGVVQWEGTCTPRGSALASRNGQGARLMLPMSAGGRPQKLLLGLASGSADIW